MTAPTIVPVCKTVVVNATQAHAFEVFTARIGDWWPMSHHTGEEQAVAVVIEPREGGRWFERAGSGAEQDWGSVLVWEPPSRVVLAWHLNADFRYDPDPARASEVEVTFHADGPSTTRVVLEHRKLERFAERAEQTRASLDAEGGWGGILQEFARLAG